MIPKAEPFPNADLDWLCMQVYVGYAEVAVNGIHLLVPPRVQVKLCDQAHRLPLGRTENLVGYGYGSNSSSEKLIDTIRVGENRFAMRTGGAFKDFSTTEGIVNAFKA